MKKLVCIVFVSFALIGCEVKRETKVTMCTLHSQNSGVTLDVNVELENDGTNVKKQTQKGVFTADETTYDAILKSLQDMGFSDKTKDMAGIHYELLEDEANKIITENIVIDITSVSGENYSVITNGQHVDESTKNIAIDVKKTVENLEEQGFTCEDK